MVSTSDVFKYEQNRATGALEEVLEIRQYLNQNGTPFEFDSESGAYVASIDHPDGVTINIKIMFSDGKLISIQRTDTYDERNGDKTETSVIITYGGQTLSAPVVNA